MIDTVSNCPDCGLPLVSAEEAAEIVGVSCSRVRVILASRPERLQVYKVGRTWVIPAQAAKKDSAR
jgi:hypothetical protein